MQVGDIVEWDVKLGDLVLGTKSGEIIATEHWHLVIKVSQPDQEKYATPFALMGMGQVRLKDSE